MSVPRIIAKVVFTGTRIFGKALAEAGRQAVRNAQHRPESAASSTAFNGQSRDAKSPGNQITNSLRMTMEEACLILNVKKEEPLDVIEKHYETIFAANAPKPPPSGTKKSPAGGSHYLQSKVFRALERIKAEKELEAAAAAEEGGAAATEGGSAAAAEAPTASEETVFTAGGGGPAPQEKGPLPPPPENEPIMTGPPPPSSSTKSS